MPADLKAWAVFQPNAPGRGEFRGGDAFGQRQLLKAAGLYLAERVVIAVGSAEVALWPLMPGRFACPCIGRWERERLLAIPVPAHGPQDSTWPGFVLVDVGHGRMLAEVRAVRHDLASERTAGLLTTR